MVLLFYRFIPQNVRELIDSGSTQNWDQAARMAHKLKSTVDSMGIKTLREDIRTVEANAKSKTDLEKIPALIARIDRVVGCR